MSYKYLYFCVISVRQSFFSSSFNRDVLDATMNYAAHSKFVAKWLDKLEAEDAAASSGAIPTTITTTEEPQSVV